MTDRIAAYEHDGLTFDVLDGGPADGDPVLLLHGFPERATCWRHVAPLLHERGLRTLAPDQRGYSPGARPRRRRDHRISCLVGDVAALVERVGRPVDVVGHDWGAVVGWALALQRPELVRTLTAVSVPHPGAYLRATLTSRQARTSWYVLAFNLPRAPERALARRGGRAEAWFRGGGATEEDVERYHAEIVEYGALPGALGWYRGIPFLDVTRVRSKVSVPTTMVWSDEDMFVARPGVDLTPRFVDAPYELVVLEGVSHWIPTQAPQALADAALRRITAA
jgi:pimeloyl-ACP methyl ester carboxylesterase